MAATENTNLHARRPTVAMLLWLTCAVALPAAAQDGPASSAASAANDPTVVISRTVNPRTAYRGVPRDENPVHTEATTFPGHVFQGTLATVMSSVVGDAALGQRGSVGVSTGAILPSLSRAMAPLTGQAMFGPAASNSAPIGAPASSGGALGSATRGLAPLITSGVMRAVAPAGQGGGR